MDLQKANKWLQISDFFPRRHPIIGDEGTLSCQPFFVVGSGRNGSTLLSAMMDAHPDLIMPTEQWRFPNMILKFKLYNFLPWKELVSLIIGEIAASNANFNWNVNFNDTLAKLQYLAKDQQSLQKILDEIYIAYAKANKQNCTLWGEKSPRNTPFIELIHQVFPKGKYIFLIRDGRDVSRSWLIKNKSEDLEWIANHWNKSIEKYQWLKKKVPPSQLSMIKYENLVSNPQEELIKIGSFLKVGFHPNMLSFQKFSERIDQTQIQHFIKLKTTANTTSIGKWDSYFKGNRRDIIHQIMGHNLKKFGYE